MGPELCVHCANDYMGTNQCSFGRCPHRNDADSATPPWVNNSTSKAQAIGQNPAE